MQVPLLRLQCGNLSLFYQEMRNAYILLQESTAMIGVKSDQSPRQRSLPPQLRQTVFT